MTKLLEIAALGGAIVGATLLALNLSISGYGYIFFLLSSLAGVKLLAKSNASRAMYWQSVFFTIINVIGVIRWLIL